MDKVRAHYLENFRTSATRIFAEEPTLRSVMLAVAQYWADEASDAVHDTVVASEREHMPLWPHRCAGNSYEDGVANIAGEICSSCGNGVARWSGGWDDNGRAVLAFQPWCHEAGNQEAPVYENALPCVVARKREDGEIEVEFVGHIERIGSLLRGVVRDGDDDDVFVDEDEGDGEQQAVIDFDEVVSLPADPAWNDPRAKELYAQVCEHPRDDAPRRVLADYLLERNVELGEYIALSLEEELDEDAHARLEHLRATLTPAWLAPLVRVVPEETARFERGFLSVVDISATEEHAESVRGHLVWNSVERIRVHGGESILHPSMRALRTLGPIDSTWLDALLSASQPWAIEELDIDDVDVDVIADLERLRDTKLLPNLRRLTVPGSPEVLGLLSKAAWWKQLERLTIRGELDEWLDSFRPFGVPWTAIVISRGEPTRADTWEFAFGPDNMVEVTQRGFSPNGSLDALKPLLAAVTKAMPSARSFKLVRSDHYDPAEADLDYIGNPLLTV